METPNAVPGVVAGACAHGHKSNMFNPGSGLNMAWGIFTGRHAGVELIERHALAQVIRVALIPQHIVETDIVNITAFKVLLGKIRGGAAAQNVFGHQFTSFIFGHCPQM